jgi:predicted DNA-binding transcriptional regulator AlpA
VPLADPNPEVPQVAKKVPEQLDRLVDKAEVLAITGRSFPTIWQWMIDGKFPRNRHVGHGPAGKSMWLASEIAAWMAALPVRPLKGDAETQHE